MYAHENAIKALQEHDKRKHKIIRCDIKGCKQEADRWISTDELSGDFDMRGKHTFYLCDEHRSMLSPEDESISFLNPETGKIRSVELGVYSCGCEACEN